VKVLILTQHFPPEPFPRPADLGRWLVGRGHQVSVVTGFPYYPTGALYPGTVMRPWSREVVDGVKVLRVPLFPDHSRSAVRRLLNYGSFSFSTALLGSALSGPADAMYVEHPSTIFGLAACFVGRVRRVPFLYAVDDVWPESVAASGMLRQPALLETIDRLERVVYRRAGAIAVVSEGNRRQLMAKGVPPGKLHFIPHYANQDTFRPVPADPARRTALGLDGHFTVMFAGHIGMAQGLDVVLAAAEELRTERDVVFLIVGDGPDADRLKEVARGRALTNVRFPGRRPANEMPDLFALADALLVHLRDARIFRGTIPSKTMAYMACGRPIIMAMDGDAAEIVRSAGAGLTCPSEDHKALAAAVRELRAMAPETRATMGQAGRQAFLRSYTQAAVFGRYEALLLGLRSRADRPSVSGARA
jgi:glycosyltransferase involved in cell wall biosynthesis